MPTPLLLLAALQSGLLPPSHLQRQVETFAGAPATVDPRLLLPACAAPELSWAVPGRSVAVHCSAPEWRVFVPVQGAPPATAPPAVPTTPQIKRGDRIVVEAGGEGFVVAMEAVAEADSRDGRVPLRAGAKRLSGVVGVDGRVRIHGLSPMVNRR